MLDVACGAGRHSRWFAQRGALVTAIDRDEAALKDLDAVARVVHADIENGPWPLPGEAFDAIIITNYLWRPLWPQLLGSLRAGGVLMAETFALGHERLGRPRNPDFLLQPGELLSVTQGLHVVAYEDGLLDVPAGHTASPPDSNALPASSAPRRVQRIVAVSCPGIAPAGRGDWPLNPG